jgi:hypothetical protein
VLTQVQRDLLDALRKSAWTFMPDYETVATRCSQGVAMLERRVDLIEELDSVYEKQRERWDISLPPSQVDQVEDLLRSASEGLRKAQLSEGEFVASKAQIDKAKVLTERMGTSDPVFGEELAGRVQSMCKELCLFKDKKDYKQAYEELSVELPGLFAMVEKLEPQPLSGEVAVPDTPIDGSTLPPLYNLLDYSLLALEICRDYIWLHGSTSPKDVLIREELEKEVKPKLRQHLARHSCSELRQARLLLRQFRENINKRQVWEAIKAGKQEMYIDYEPAEIRYLQLVQFRIGFRREALNWSGAKEFVVPEWDFGDCRRDRGCWMPSHFFPDPRPWWKKISDWFWWRIRGMPERVVDPKPVHVSFERPPDPTNPTTKQKEKALYKNVPVRKDSSDDRWTRTFTEVVALLVSIFVPLIALVAGAREQLAQNPAGDRSKGVWTALRADLRPEDVDVHARHPPQPRRPQAGRCVGVAGREAQRRGAV